jgi:hypothetical protein
MNCKPNLLGASALYGTLALVALGTAQPARAACTTLTDDQQRKILTCTGDNEGPVAVPVDIDQFRNSGTIVPAAVICPLLSGPKLRIFWMTKETWNAEQEASPGRDYRQAA